MEQREFKVVGYYPCWEPEGLDSVDYGVLTHINYAFSIPTAEGHLLPLRNPDTARRLIADAHARGVRVMIVVGGWDYLGEILEETFVKATDTPEKREQLAGEMISLCMEYGFDGIDVDWEYPRAGKASAQQYEDLMLDLRTRLTKLGKLLTCAVFAGINPDGETLADVPAYSQKVLEACDWINIMAYDGGDGVDHSTFEFAVGCADCWKNQNIPGEKLVLGVPFYGRPTWTTYRDLIQRDPEACSRDMTEVDGIQVYYNGIPTIRRKTLYAKENLGGIMIWELTQDSREKDKSLLAAIGRAAR